MQEQATYTLARLSQQYKEMDLQPNTKQEIEVTDEEVCLFLNHTHKVWGFAFWGFVSILTALFASGVIHG